MITRIYYPSINMFRKMVSGKFKIHLESYIVGSRENQHKEEREMKRMKTYLMASCGMLMLLFFAANTFAGEATIIGTIYATDWDDSDNVTAVSITTKEGEEYAIVNNAVGKKLFKLDLKKVTVTGVLGKDGDGNKTITVSKFKVITEDDDDEENEENYFQIED